MTAARDRERERVSFLPAGNVGKVLKNKLARKFIDGFDIIVFMPKEKTRTRTTRKLRLEHRE